jgi:hypothetical protein
MCKGKELSAFLKEHEEYEKVVYIGDGSNDFCPVVRLRESVIAHSTDTTILTSPFLPGRIWCWPARPGDYRGELSRMERKRVSNAK